MSDDLQADITTRAGGTMAAFDQINAKMIQLERNTKKVNQALDQQDRLTKKMSLGHGLQMAGKGISSAGGGVIGRVFRGAGMEGGWGEFSVGLGTVALAMGAVTGASNRAAEAARAAAESMTAHAKAIEQGQSVQEQQGEKGLARLPSRRALLASGGQAALDAADKLARGGVLSEDDARSVAAKAFARHGDTKRARAAIDAVEAAARVGLDSSQIQDQIINSNAALDNPLSTNTLLSRIYQKQTGRLGLSGYKQAQMNVIGDKELKSGQKVNGLKVDLGQIYDKAVVDGSAEAGVRKEKGRAANPILTAVGDAYKAMSEKIAADQKAADAQFKLVAAFQIAAEAAGIGSGGDQGSVNKAANALKNWGEQ